MPTLLLRGGRGPRANRLRRLLPLFLFLGLASFFILSPGTTRAAQAAVVNPSRVYFAESGHYLAFGFLNYWRHNGGYTAYGPPISEELTENGRTVQYFQRARFEYHQELKGTPYETSLGLLGSETLALRGYPQTQGNPWTKIAPVPNTATQYYSTTYGHSVRGAFKTFWQSAPLTRYGYPISEAYTTVVDGHTTLAQDFERVRMLQQGTGPVSLLNLGFGVAQSKNVSTAAIIATAGVPVYTIAAMTEHWVEVNLSRQTEYFHEGPWIERTSLISSGKPGHETPVGTFYINRRVYNETMVGGTLGAEDYYYLTNVLYTQYFTYEGHALHYAWWRKTFGVTGSHGCVNEDYDTALFAWNWLKIGSRVVIHY